MAYRRGLVSLGSCSTLTTSARGLKTLTKATSRTVAPVCGAVPSSWGSCSGAGPLLAPGVRGYSVTVTPDQDNIMRSPLPDIEIPVTPLGSWVMDKIKQHGDLVAKVNGVTGETTTFSQLHTQIWRVGSSLHKLGLRKGDVVTIFAPNCPQYTVTYVALQCMGVIASAVNPVYTVDELTHALSHSGSKVLVTVPELMGVGRPAVINSSCVKHTVVFGESDGCIPFSTFLEDDGTAFPENVDIDPMNDTAALPYSSGTTGVPKGVMLTYYNLVANIEQALHKDVMCFQPVDSLLAVLPFFHIYGQVLIMLGGLVGGTTTITMPKFDPELYVNNINQHRITFLHIAPPLALFLARHPLGKKADLSTVHSIFCGAAPLSPSLVDEMIANTGYKGFFRQGYGMTETSPLTHASLKADNIHESVGHAIPNTEYKIVDMESGKALGPNETGELWSRGPQVMKGYFNNPTATADTVTPDGWIKSGDIGHYGDRGHVFITDRLKELIKYKGFQVAPAELEALILTHPSVQDVAVIGIPDEMAGEVPRAYVVCKPDAKPSEEEVANFVAEKVAPYKQLRGGVEFCPEIPKSASGKILRRNLKEKYLS